ncbi:MAG: nitroreductase family deazaflavin-dependent oxidoreductase [Anaerolineales bacterium]|nr:nitroreductase family deazaflavin-dependent oxidoreductase [Anaerolineales bacterium]
MTFDPKLEEKLRQGFKYLNKFILTLWRLGLGGWLNAWPQVLGRYMVITHTGRKSGLKRQTPVNYTELDGEVYCTAGFGKISDWYQNMLANPEVEIWLPDGWWQGVAIDVSEAENRIEILRAVLVASGFAGPLFGLDPRKMDDAQLAKAGASYRLVRIERSAARTGPGGPGELAWIWPLATFLLLPLVVCRRRR